MIRPLSVAPLATFMAVLLLATAAPVATGQIVRPPRLNVQYHRAETAFRSGNSILEAKARIDRVLNQLPQDIEARKLRASIFLSMDRPKDALEDARKAVRLRPDDGEAQLLVCESAADLGLKQEATRALHHSADLLVDHPDLHLRLSMCALQIDRFDEAQAYARIALAGKPRDPTIYLHLAHLFVLSGDTDKARTLTLKGLSEGILSVEALQTDSLLSRFSSESKSPR
jgi:Flp pilus assembly protein TadD